MPSKMWTGLVIVISAFVSGCDRSQPGPSEASARRSASTTASTTDLVQNSTSLLTIPSASVPHADPAASQSTTTTPAPSEISIDLDPSGYRVLPDSKMEVQIYDDRANLPGYSCTYGEIAEWSATNGGIRVQVTGRLLVAAPNVVVTTVLCIDEVFTYLPLSGAEFSLGMTVKRADGSDIPRLER